MTVSRRFPIPLWRAPAVVAGLLCCCLTALLVVAIKAETHGLFVYPLDDSYIHLALARMLAVHHVWGIGPGEFASASSSPGWTLILAAVDFVAGPHLMTPIFLNLAFIFCLLFAVDYGMNAIAPDAPRWVRYGTPIVLVLGTPLASLALIGMEHVAQTLSILLLVVLASQILAAAPAARVSRGKIALLLASAAFAGAIRYEAVFAIAPVFVLLLWRRRGGIALLLALCSAIGPVGFGLYSHHLSGFWLPFSVLAKAAAQDDKGISHLPRKIYNLIKWRSGMPFIWTLLPIWLLRLRTRRFWETSQLLLFLTLVVSFTHMVVAPIGWLMRYESYFVCLGLYALGVALALTVWPQRPREYLLRLPLWDKALIGAAIVGLVLMLPTSLYRRIKTGTITTVQAAVDRYDEHIQMARFVKENYDHDTIVVDDIGAVAYYAHTRLLDIVGLGSAEPLVTARRRGKFTAEDIAQWAAAQGAPIAILQSGTVETRAMTPPEWTLVQTWRLPRNVIFYDYDVSFYATRPSAVPRLCDALAKFALTPDDAVSFNACPVANGVAAASK